MEEKKWTVEHEDGTRLHISAGGRGKLELLEKLGYESINLQDGSGWRTIRLLLTELTIGKWYLHATS